ncbi:hypothetical protein BGZ94_000452 [Podila epigama]|nr:hypothetical protein BGZ94_000452 [Podila epigama]
MRLATVRRLQLLWGLLVLFSFMAWLALMPAYAFRSQSDTFSRFINHPITQTTTIIIAVALTVFNFFSWTFLAAHKDAGAKTECQTGTGSDQTGYTTQCHGVNAAIVLDVLVFLCWIPMTLVLVCGRLERVLWWWGEDDGANAHVAARGSNMMSEEEFDLKMGFGKRKSGRKNKNKEDVANEDNICENNINAVNVQQPSEVYVTPIASQFQSKGLESGHQELNDESEQDIGFSPSSYRKHRLEQQQQLSPLQRKNSNTSLAPSLTARLSTIFGTGWGNGAMPPASPEPSPPPTPRASTQQKQNRRKSRLREEHPKPSSSLEDEQVVDTVDVRHGGNYSTQWHSRRDDDWS